MQDTQKDRDHYPDEPPPLPEYDISPSLKKLVLLCIGTMLINFLVAGACGEQYCKKCILRSTLVIELNSYLICELP